MFVLLLIVLEKFLCSILYPSRVFFFFFFFRASILISCFLYFLMTKEAGLCTFQQTF